jgi:predicted acylesterase/phospholipase RssA
VTERVPGKSRQPRGVPLAAPPRIALALGGGGARGLAHILMLEVFDELGLKPTIIAGTSIGALFGAAYASGLSARLIRAHTEEVLGQPLGPRATYCRPAQSRCSGSSTCFRSARRS